MTIFYLVKQCIWLTEQKQCYSGIFESIVRLIEIAGTTKMQPQIVPRGDGSASGSTILSYCFCMKIMQISKNLFNRFIKLYLDIGSSCSSVMLSSVKTRMTSKKS